MRQGSADTTLHDLRIDAVLRRLQASGAASVLDLGCGRGALLKCLLPVAQFTRLVGIDIEMQALAQARQVLGLDLLHPHPRMSVSFGSFEEVNLELAGFDAAVLLETIEHIDAGRLPRMERAVFVGMHPRLILVTTPNRDYNPVHGLARGERRHPGHRFEWTRAQFRQWADGVAQRNGYSVDFDDLGWPQPEIGGSSQMASFVTL
jgi:small RNA 2'-O-methyltransferase